MAGLSCADGLKAFGHDVILLDKARGAGGRMSTRRVETSLGEVSFDHGAQYFTARSPDFCKQVESWAARGIVRRWQLPAPDAWIGAPGMNAMVKAMAGEHDVRWNVHVNRIERHAGGWLLEADETRFGDIDTAILAIPAEQALPFLSLHNFSMAREALLARSQPCWTAMFTLSQPLIQGPDMIRDEDDIAWAARNNAKPGRGGPEGWVVQARPEWSARHIDRPADEIAMLLWVRLCAALKADLPGPIAASAHRWRYAMSGGLGLGSLWNAPMGLGVCGDWLLGPRIECAWVSGQDLARQIVEMPSG
ncbi:deoxyribodipyrimidine photolyase [Sphingomonas sp. KC8]|nr:deoxyribodipyrimidine photolyase [Sphingomonas sp. KC8]